jgi:hypothetical protein
MIPCGREPLVVGTPLLAADPGASGGRRAGGSTRSLKLG